MKKKSEIKVGLLGLGTVGSGVAEILTRQSARLKDRAGISIVISRVFVRHPSRLKKQKLSTQLFASSWQEIVDDPSIDIVVELLGGVDVARQAILAAIRAGKSVVTANKALLALHGEEIFSLARKHQVDVCFEAAVGGGIPILRSIREGFSANEIRSIFAIINGTCNYILSEMSEKNTDFHPTLKKAQELGYAERDPSFDIDGIDAAQKLSILISMMQGKSFHPRYIFVEGIRRVSALDIDYARRFGFVIKLLAIAKRTEKGMEARVHPVMIPHSNPLASVREAFNAILLEGDYAGPSLLYGRGAGRYPTASAVAGDIIEIARNRVQNISGTVPPLGFEKNRDKPIRLCKIVELESEYYLRIQVTDRPGALAQITRVLGGQQISISSVYQHGQKSEKTVPLVLLTHRASEFKIQKALTQIAQLEVVKEKPVLIRIERMLENV